MAEHEAPDQEPKAQSHLPQEPQPKGRQSFRKVRRQLNDEELSSPAVQKLLIDEIERLEGEAAELSGFRDQYYEEYRKCAVLEEKNKTSNPHEILYGVCLTMGSVALGFAPNLWPHQPAGWMSVAFSIVLIGGGVLTKVLRR